MLGGGLEVHVLDIRNEANERLAERFKMTALPLVVLVDGAGKELWRHDGFVDYQALASAVRTRLGAATGAYAPGKETCAPGADDRSA